MNAMKNVPKVQMTSPFLAGLLYAAVWLALGALALSIMLRWGSMAEQSLPQYSLIIHGLSSFSGGFVSGKRSGKRGWYYGGTLGLAYGLLVLLIGFLAANAGIDKHTLAMIAEAALCGLLGGMIGVNLRRG